jgi:hypothetical protein
VTNCLKVNKIFKKIKNTTVQTVQKYNEKIIGEVLEFKQQWSLKTDTIYLILGYS